MTKLLNFMDNLPIGFGGASISGEGKGYGFGKVSESDAITLLNTAYEHGIRLFDTAPIYGFGESEKRIGKAFKNRQEEIFIVSKSGVSWHEDSLRVDMTNDPKTTQLMLEASLKRLSFDYIDLYMIHWPDAKVDIRRPMEVLAKAKDQGKIKHIGLCNTNVDELIKASEIEKIDAVQSQLNLFEKDVIDDLFPYLKENNISFMSWGTLDKGIISGSVTVDRVFDKEDCRSWAPWWKKSNYREKVLKMQPILSALNESGKNGVELALGHNLAYEEVDCVLVGAKSIAQLKSLLQAHKSKLNDEEVRQYLEKL